MTEKTNLGLVDWVYRWLGQAYWYGTCVYSCTKSLLTSKAKQYPSHYGDSRMKQYHADIAATKKCADCVGLIKGYYWTREDGTMKYGLDGRPDKGANGMFSAAKESGPINTLPEILGLLLHSPGHVGVYVGDGWAIEARGFAHGIVKTRVSERKWTHWFKCPYITYVDGDTAKTVHAPMEQAAQRILYNLPGDLIRGPDVYMLQARLMSLGYDPGKLDGKFGSKTEAAVKAFQQALLLEPNGVVDSETWEVLRDAYDRGMLQRE